MSVSRIRSGETDTFDTPITSSETQVVNASEQKALVALLLEKRLLQMFPVTIAQLT